MRTNQIEQSRNTYNIIDETLRHRIPGLSQIRVDDNPESLSQADMFGNIDTILSIGGSERFTMNQNKSRCPDADTICIECRSFSGLAYNMASDKRTPIAGMHYVETLRRYLTPRFSQIDTITIYMASEFTVFHFHRYFLEILFSKPEIWKHVKKYYITNDRTDTIVIYIDALKFVKLYIEEVVRVTCGDYYSITLEEPEENKLVPKEIS